MMAIVARSAGIRPVPTRMDRILLGSIKNMIGFVLKKDQKRVRVGSDFLNPGRTRAGYKLIKLQKNLLYIYTLINPKTNPPISQHTLTSRPLSSPTLNLTAGPSYHLPASNTLSTDQAPRNRKLT